jgi:hypothetical protein
MSNFMQCSLFLLCYPSHQAVEKLAVALLVCPRNEQVTLAVPPAPCDSMCQVQPTTPVLPTVCADPPNERGACPVEYTTLVVHTAPAAVLA